MLTFGVLQHEKTGELKEPVISAPVDLPVKCIPYVSEFVAPNRALISVIKAIE